MAAAFVGVASPASAAYTDCASGNGCMWTSNDYPGSPNASFGNQVVLSSSNNLINSIVNNGINVAPSTTYFYDRSDFTGAAVTLAAPAAGVQWRDPNLSNGTDLTTTNWANKISSAKYR
jgi:hypothetical protein